MKKLVVKVKQKKIWLLQLKIVYSRLIRSKRDQIPLKSSKSILSKWERTETQIDLTRNLFAATKAVIGPSRRDVILLIIWEYTLGKDPMFALSVKRLLPRKATKTSIWRVSTG